MRKGSHKQEEFNNGRHRYEHWYRDNSIYFITARCRGRTHAFKTEACKAIFWDRFLHYAGEYGFIPIIVSLLDNHYHLLGYLKIGENLAPLMQRFHGSAAKLVNDQLDERLLPFWIDTGRHNYFDGCLRDTTQFRRTYRYVNTQSVRHGICTDPLLYPHTRRFVEPGRAEQRALTLRSFLENVPYARYDRRRK